MIKMEKVKNSFQHSRRLLPAAKKLSKQGHDGIFDQSYQPCGQILTLQCRLWANLHPWKELNWMNLFSLYCNLYIYLFCSSTTISFSNCCQSIQGREKQNLNLELGTVDLSSSQSQVLALQRLLLSCTGLQLQWCAIEITCQYISTI